MTKARSGSAKPRPARKRPPLIPWEPYEVDIALAMHAEGATLAQIAEKLPGRTPPGIWKKIQKAGARPKTEEEREAERRQMADEAFAAAMNGMQFSSLSVRDDGRLLVHRPPTYLESQANS